MIPRSVGAMGEAVSVIGSALQPLFVASAKGVHIKEVAIPGDSTLVPAHLLSPDGHLIKRN